MSNDREKTKPSAGQAGPGSRDIKSPPIDTVGSPAAVSISRAAASRSAGSGADGLEDQIETLARERLELEFRAQRVDQLEAELKILRTEKRNADLEIVELNTLLRTTQSNLQKVHDTVTYRLGKILTDGFASWRGFRRLPRRLVMFLWKNLIADKRRRAGAGPASSLEGASRQVSAIAEALSEVRRNGPEQAAHWARAQNFEPTMRARIFLEIARVIRKTDVNTAIALAKESISLAPSEQRIKWLAFALADTGAVTEPADLLRGVIDAGVVLNGTESRKADELFALVRIAGSPPSIPPRKAAVRQSFSRRALLVSNRSLPFHWNAATMRLHTSAVALQRGGWLPEIVTLPGYPVREGDNRPLREMQSMIAGVPYHRLPATAVSAHMTDLYIGEAAEMIARFAAEANVSVIHAAADCVTAFAAIAAARMVDIPCVVDCAELVPEVPSIAPELRASESFALFERLQRIVLREADAVIARSAVLHDRLREAGVAVSSVRQLPDCGTLPASGRPRVPLVRPAALQGRKVIGYIGEGGAEFDLEMLPVILAQAVREGIDAALYVVGVGPQFERLQAVANELGVGDRLAQHGRPRLQELADHYAMIDVAVLPYRGRTWRAPYELTEAISHGVPAVAADHTDIRQIAADGGSAVPFAGVAEAAVGLLRNDEARHELAVRARRRADREFGIDDLTNGLLQVYVQAWRRAGGAVVAASPSLVPLGPVGE